MAQMTNYQEYIGLSRYARWLPEEKKREDWSETVERYVDFMVHQAQKKGYEIPLETVIELYEYIYELSSMPSMRCMMTAGKALDRDNVAGFNCSYTPVDNLRSFDEIMYILLCGTGVGFSVERQDINKLPEVAEEMYESDTTIVVKDSKIGWAKAFRELLSMLWSGQIPQWDMSRVRLKGERLKTFGGRASGPEPLDELFRFTVQLITKAKGRKLNSLECHDLVCKVADIVVVGGVRRSALISLSNLTDERMRHAKAGQWWVDEPQRQLANNSVAYTEKPDMGIFMKEWHALYESKSGERGIFSRPAVQKLIPERRGKKVIVTLEDGSKKTFLSNEMVNGKVAVNLEIGDEIS